MGFELALLISRAPDVESYASAVAPGAGATLLAVGIPNAGSWLLRWTLTNAAVEANDAFILTAKSAGAQQATYALPMVDVMTFDKVLPADIVGGTTWQIRNLNAGGAGVRYSAQLEAWWVGP